MNELGAALVLGLGAVHVEACVPLLIQCATARPDLPAGLLALAYHRSILGMSPVSSAELLISEAYYIVATIDTVLAARSTKSTTRHAAVVQAIRAMESASGKKGNAVAWGRSPVYARYATSHCSTHIGRVCATALLRYLDLHYVLRCCICALQHMRCYRSSLLRLSACHH